MVTTDCENPLATEHGTRAALDALHHVFVLLHLHAVEAVKKKKTYTPEFICELSDWLEVLPTYLLRDDAAAVDEFRNGLAAIAELHSCFGSVLRRFDDKISNILPGTTSSDDSVNNNGTRPK